MLIVSVTDSDKGYSVRPHDPRTENPASKSTAESQVSSVFEIGGQMEIKSSSEHCLEMICKKCRSIQHH